MPVDSDLRVAIASGPGTGRFLAAALTDALGGAGLAAIIVPARPPAGSRWGIEFVFHGETDSEEVICVGLDASGTVVTAEILRRPSRPVLGSSPSPAALTEALAGGDAVSSIQWSEAPDGSCMPILHITMRSDQSFIVDLEA